MLNKLLNFIPVFIFFSKINSLQALLEMFDIFETLQNNTFFYLKEWIIFQMVDQILLSTVSTAKKNIHLEMNKSWWGMLL